MGFLDGKVAVITGAGGGIGRSHALTFAKEGAKVVVNDLGGSRDGSGASHSMADKVVDEIKASGGTAAANYDSVSTEEGAKAIVQTALDNFGRIDILVNNAGILRDKTLVNMSRDMWDLVIAVHLTGTCLCGQAAARAMKDHGQGGSIINTSSYAGLKGNFGQSNYGAAKAGIYGLTMVWAMELAKYNIRSNAIAPLAKTRMTEDISMVPDTAKAEDITPMVLYLASDLSKSVTGRVFGIHGKQLFEYKMLMTPGVTKSDGDWSADEIQAKLADIGKG